MLENIITTIANFLEIITLGITMIFLIGMIILGIIYALVWWLRGY